jgi:glutathione synthase/RimK-type ligase-like ATP-grasp enzyme
MDGGVGGRTTVDPDRLNRECSCETLESERLMAELDADRAGLAALVSAGRPHLFSATSVFVSRADLAAMAAIVGAVEAVVHEPWYERAVLEWADPVARLPTRSGGAFLGFDFHLGADGPKLIEINTNAAGALLGAKLARAQEPCCDEMRDGTAPATGIASVEDDFVAMFREEWRRERGAAPLRRIAIVDDDPTRQFFHPEFELFRALFEAHGIAAAIVAPESLSLRADRLVADGAAIDLVYNRLTDFPLAEPAHRVLRAAYATGAAVVTPNPRAYALYADKRNLTLLSDPDLLAAHGVPQAVVERLASGVPRTVQVTAANAAGLHAERGKLFFKPVQGYGGKATYRGANLTRRVWAEIESGGYVAQALVPPGSRVVAVAGETRLLKLDIRLYVYAGRVQLAVARLYQGQTTNFRTAGGGFAPVLTTA